MLSRRIRRHGGYPGRLPRIRGRQFAAIAAYDEVLYLPRAAYEEHA